VKVLTIQEIESFFRSIESKYDVRVPISLHDGTRSLGMLGDGSLALAGGVIPEKITSLFFPQMEVILSVSSTGVEAAPGIDKPLMIVGFTAQDADCLAFIDKFFAENFRDDVYFSKRDGAIVVCVSGRCGVDGEFLKIAGGKCDIELVSDGEKFLVAAYTDAGKALVESLSQGVDAEEGLWEALYKESDALSNEDEELIRAASQLLVDEKVPDEFWKSISDRCIACTSCNLCCPTCTCFDVFDRSAGEKTERWRLWDSCQLDGFMREASGHNPMGEESVRTRRRIHHKLAADPTRWNEITCFLCGRCDEVCPTGIGIKAVCREILAEYGNVK
jgi:sulfhydrogenase subunit beta (sulfur reductase)